MGSSNHAGTKGIPATPRAGTPVELTALLYHCLKTFSELHKKGKYSFNSVQFQNKTIEYHLWAEKIEKNFDKLFYLKDNPHEESRYVKGIYKDLVNSPVMFDE